VTPTPSASDGAAAVDPLVDVLAYLITAARTQLDEAAEYAPMRILTAAQRLGDALRPDAPDALRRLITALDAVPPTATPRTDRAEYTSMVDGLCAELADCLIALTATEPEAGDDGPGHQA
jgi:hypothetical protein